jgi:hypothetical protein
MADAAYVWLRDLRRRCAARLRRRHRLGAALVAHLTAAISLTSIQQLSRHEARKTRRPKQRQKRGYNPECAARLHFFKSYSLTRFRARKDDCAVRPIVNASSHTQNIPEPASPAAAANFVRHIPSKTPRAAGHHRPLIIFALGQGTLRTLSIPSPSERCG